MVTSSNRSFVDSLKKMIEGLKTAAEQKDRASNDYREAGLAFLRAAECEEAASECCRDAAGLVDVLEEFQEGPTHRISESELSNE